MQPKTVLLVEDDRAISLLLSLVFQRHGYTVLHAENRTEAIRLLHLHSNDVQLLLSDVALQNDSGEAVAAQVRTLCPGTAVVFLSGFPLEILVERGFLQSQTLRDGNTFFIQKPFLPNDLLELVERIPRRERETECLPKSPAGGIHNACISY